MWRNTHKDYPPDQLWLQEVVEPGKGIVGCEMHEINGWGLTQQLPKQSKRNWFRTLIHLLITKKR